MNIKEYLRNTIDVLKIANIEASVLEAGVVLCHVLKCDRTYLYSHDDRVLDKDELERLDYIVGQRVDKVPIQYLVGETEFMSLPFVVSPAVLIPRQDTELLVEKCIELINRRKVNVLDMCTGSGCIAISIAHYCPDSRVLACDVSQDALEIAKQNSERIGVQDRLELRCGDLFQAVGGEQQFDIIVSNPPYIETQTITGLQKEVREYEPGIALDGGADGLDFYRRIIAMAPSYLTCEGYLAFEIGYNQGQSVKNLMECNFKDIKIYKDISGNDRVVIGVASS